MIPDVWAMAVTLLALVISGGLAFWQFRGKSVWLWAWFIPGGLVLVYGLITVMLGLTRFRAILGVGYNEASLLRGLWEFSPWTTGVSGLFFAVSAVIVSFRGRVDNWRVALPVLGAGVLFALMIGGWVFARVSVVDTLEFEFMDARAIGWWRVIGLWPVVWAVTFLLAIVGCARGAAGRLSRDRAVLLAILASCAGAMIVLGCLLPVAQEQMYQVEAYNRLLVVAHDFMAMVNGIVVPGGLLALVGVLVGAALMLRQSTVRVALPKRREIVGLLGLCVLVGGLMGVVSLRFGDAVALYTQHIQREQLGPLPHSTDAYIVPLSSTGFDSDDSGLGVVLGRESLNVTLYYNEVGRLIEEKADARIAFSRGEAFPEEFGKRVGAVVEERKKAAGVRGNYESGVTLAADQLTDYQTLYALIVYLVGYEFGLSPLQLLVQRDSGYGIRAGRVHAMVTGTVREKFEETVEGYEPEDEPHVHISKEGFEVSFRSATLAAKAGCAKDGPTVCASVPADRLDAMLEEARALFLQGQNEPAQKLADEYVNSFDFRGLYHQMVAIKKDVPDVQVVMVNAEADVPYHLVIKVLDTVRYFREQDHYETDEAFEKAAVRVTNNNYVRLFVEPVLAAP